MESCCAEPTGFNPGFGQSPFGSGSMMAGVPPVPPLPQQQQPVKDTSPANIFAQMKAGTFGSESAPQSSGENVLVVWCHI